MSNRFFFASLALSLTLLTALPASAATRTITLEVPGMTCPACPVTLRTALDRLRGVHVQRSDLKLRTVTVVVTDDRVSNAELTQATANVGYPSTVLNRKSP